MTATEKAERREPRNVARFAWLAYASIGLGAIVSALEYDHVSTLTDPRSVLIVTGIVFSLFLLLIWQVQRGRNWARWAYLVLFIVGMPSYLPQLMDMLDRNPPAGALSLAQTLLQIVALILVFTGDAKPYFARTKGT